MKLVLLSAPSGSGKTTACARLLDTVQQNNLSAAGILSIPIFQAGEKTAIHLQNVATGEERPFARRALPHETPDIGYWRMDKDTIAWGNTCLDAISRTDLLLIDEIGPLELIQGRGLTRALPALENAGYRLAIVTMRPSLMESLKNRLGRLKPSIIVLDKENRDTIPTKLFHTIISHKDKSL